MSAVSRLLSLALIFVCTISGSSSLSVAGEVVAFGRRPQPKPLTLSYRIVTQLEFGTDKVEIFTNALEIAMLGAPADVTLVRASDDSQADFKLELVGEGENEKAVKVPLHRMHQRLQWDSMAGVTLALAHLPAGPYFVRLNWDALYSKSKEGQPVFTEKNMARLVEILVHQIYGQVASYYREPQRLISPPAQYSDKTAFENRLYFKTQADQVWRDGLERILTHHGDELSPALKAEFEARFQHLRKLENPKGSLTRAQRCEALFQAI